VEQDIVKACVCLNVLEARSKHGDTSELNMQWTSELTDEQLHEMRRLSDKLIRGGLRETSSEDAHTSSLDGSTAGIGISCSRCR
jgi:hypothetical protein